MGQGATRTRENRTITVDFQDETTYFQLLGDGKAFIELVLAFILSLGFQLKHKAACHGGGCLTRHSHYFLADEKHSRCLTEKVYLPTIVYGRVLWHLGYTEHASAAAFTQSYQEFQRVASQQEPSYRIRGILTDGFDSTTSSMRTLFPGARLG